MVYIAIVLPLGEENYKWPLLVPNYNKPDLLCVLQNVRKARIFVIIGTSYPVAVQHNIARCLTKT